MASVQEGLTEFREIYFDERCHSFEECKEGYYDVRLYPDHLFSDVDFLFIDLIYNSRKMGSTCLEEQLGIYLDYYFEILPIDIQEQYKTKHITLTGEVSSMLKYIEDRLLHGNLYELFWANDVPVKEECIQLILENIMYAYFYNQDIEITREALLGNGKVDFKLYKNSNEEEKVLIEIKRASSS